MVGDFNKVEHDIGELLGIVLAMVQERIGIVIGGSLFLCYIPLLTMVPAFYNGAMLSTLPKDQVTPEKLFPLLISVSIGFLVYLPLYYGLRAGWISICLKITKGEAAPFSELFANFGFLLTFLGLHILMGLAIVGGFLAFIAPGIFLAIKFCFAPFLVIDKRMGPIEALQTSWQMVDGYKWKISLAYLFAVVANVIVSFIPLLGLVGQALIMAFMDLLIISLYREKNEDLAEPAR